MKIFIKRSLPLIFTTIFISMAVMPACAQGWKKGVQKLPKTLGKKPPLTGTAPVVRPNVPRVPPKVGAAATVPSTALNAAVERKVVQAQTAVQLPQPKDFLTGVQALQTLRPGWKSELMLSGFTRQQLELVEQAFKETDQFLFETDEAGKWVKPRSAEWNYTARYTQILTDNAWGEMALNDGQIKTLFGKFSRLDDVFTRLNLQSFLLTHENRAPKAGSPGEEGKLARKVKYNLDKRDGRKMNVEVEGYVYGNMPAKLRAPKPSYGPKGRAPRRTPEQVWEEVTQFMRDHNGKIPNRTAKGDYERKLRVAWDNIYDKKQGSNDPYVQRLIKLHDETVAHYADDKTPQEILGYMTQYMREHNGKLPSENSQDPVEKSYRVALITFHQKYKDLTDAQVEELDETERALEQLFRESVREKAAYKTPQEILEYTTKFMREHNGKLPSRYSRDEVEKSNHIAFENFHRKYKDLTDAQLEELPEPERTLEKLYRQEVKQISAPKTPQEILDYMTKYMQEHNGKLPSERSQDAMEKSYRKALRSFHAKYKDLTDEQVEELPDPDRALEKLFRDNVRAYNKKSAE